MSPAARNPLPGVPTVESLLFPELSESSGWDAETQRIGRDLHEKGFAAFDFPDVDFEKRSSAIKARLAPKFDLPRWRNVGWGQGQGLREQDAWRNDADVRAIACNARVLEILSRVYGRRAWPFQTLNFPVGTQQHYHSDSVHFSSVPERFMCGVWVALEDVPEDAGPLVYYPGSHRWPILYNEMIGFYSGESGAKEPTQEIYEEAWERLVRASRIEPHYFLPKRGQALIWSANLLHGGAAHKNPELTRWSQVTHYFFDDCTYITPMLSDPFLGRLMVRDLVDITTGKVVENRYAGGAFSARLADAHSKRAPSQPSAPAKTAREKPVTADTSAPLPADFDPARYVALHQDVKAAGVDPTTHYRLYGRKEGRAYK